MANIGGFGDAFVVGGEFNTAAPAPVSGQKVPLQVDSAGNLLVNAAIPGTPNVNVAEVGGAPVSLGAKASASSIPVVLATDEAALTVTQSVAANLNATVSQSDRTKLYVNTNGVLKTYVFSPPAAGVDFSITVPVGVRWVVLAVFASFTASAQTATRAFYFNFADENGNTFFDSPAIDTVVANSAALVSAGPGIPYLSQTTTAKNLQIALPVGFQMKANYTASSVTSGIQTLDQWSGARFLVEEWTDGGN